MSLIEQRAFLTALRKCGDVASAAASLSIDPSLHRKWMKEELYRNAYQAVTAEMREPAKPAEPAKEEMPPPARRPRGRPRKEIAAPEVQAGGGASLNAPQPPADPAMNPGAGPTEQKVATPEPQVTEHLFPGNRGYVRIFAPEGAEVQPPAPDPPKPPRLEPDPVATMEVTISSDATQRAMIDEYGELDRRMQLRATDNSKYESLKRAIKTWFAGVPPDADGTVEGDVYLLHLSACERERRVCDNAALAALIGQEKFYELARVSIGDLENLLGKAHVATLTTEARTGSRRIKAIPKRPAAQ